MKDLQKTPRETESAGEPEPTPVQIADNSDIRTPGEPNFPRIETTPTMKVQS
jgi:hypothetical protein